jgi:hypothetical protein
MTSHSPMPSPPTLSPIPRRKRRLEI